MYYILNIYIFIPVVKPASSKLKGVIVTIITFLEKLKNALTVPIAMNEVYIPYPIRKYIPMYIILKL